MAKRVSKAKVQEVKEAQPAEINEFVIEAKYHSKNEYGNPTFYVSPLTSPDSFRIVKTIHDKLSSAYSDLYNPIWIPCDEFGDVKFAKITMNNLTKDGYSVKAKAGCIYELRFNISIRKTTMGKRFILLRLVKAPKFLEANKVDDDEELVSIAIVGASPHS